MDSGRISHYRILSKLGKGGMGEVYLAEDTELGRKVALKFLPEALQADETARKRLLREARSAAALDHPYICHVYESGEERGRPFIAMEYVEGRTLKDLLASTKPSTEESLRIAIEIAEALELAHEKGLLHRDLKPANIMLARKGHTKVMDFGLAKQFASNGGSGEDVTATALTQEGVPVGTVAYMSPEQIKGRELDARTDIFSFGIVLYEMLAGIHPFARPSGMEMIGAILHDEPSPLAQSLHQPSELLVHAVGKMLAKDPDERYQSMHEIRTDLKQIVQGGKSEERAPGGASPFLRKLRPAWLAAAILLVAFSAAGLSWWVLETWYRSPAAALAFAERDWILITDFANTTGEPVFDGSLDTAMAVSIQQSKYVNVFPRSRVPQVLALMRRENEKKIDENLGKDIAIRAGIKGLLVCGIGKIGGEYVLTAQLVDPRTSATVYSRAEYSQGRQGVLGALETLANDIRGQLGESLANITATNIPLPQATTDSLEALKAFAQSGGVGGPEKVKLLIQAVELDPDFALAHANLGMQYYIEGESIQGEEHFKKAIALMGRLTLRERLWIRAVVADWRGERKQGIEDYKAYLAQYPDDSNAWFRLGYTCLITNTPEEAVDAFQRVLKLDPREAAALVNIATAYNAMKGHDAEAVENYEKAFAMDPKLQMDPIINHEYGFLLVKIGQRDRARQVFEKMLSQQDAVSRARGRRSLSLLDMLLGRYDEASEHLDQAIAINRAGGFSLSELRDRLFLAQLYAAKQKKAEFDRQMDEAGRLIRKIRPSPYWVLYAGRLDARHGRVRDAQAMLEMMIASLGDPTAASGVDRNNKTDMAAIEALKGEIALAGNRFQDAVDFFLAADGLAKDFANEPLALASYREGNLEEAAAGYGRFLDEDKLGQQDQEEWIVANYQLARISEQLGDTAKAREYYRRFLDLWQNGDPDLPFVAEAKNKTR